MTCGISSWPDTDALYERLAALLDAPIRPLPRDRMAEVLAYFEEKCAGSKRRAEEAARVIPGGVQHNLVLQLPVPPRRG